MSTYGTVTKQAVKVLLCASLSLGLGGCLHQRVKLPVFPPNQPVSPDAVNADNLPGVDVPEVESLPDPVAAAASHPRQRRRFVPRASTTPATNAPMAVPNAEPGAAEESAIGELTAGGDANPQRKQEAVDLMASNERRIKALSLKVLAGQRPQVSKIRNFQRQANLALRSGDAEGAMTLATKAGLLLHDLDGSNN